MKKKKKKILKTKCVELNLVDFSHRNLFLFFHVFHYKNHTIYECYNKFLINLFIYQI